MSLIFAFFFAFFVPSRFILLLDYRDARRTPRNTNAPLKFERWQIWAREGEKVGYGEVSAGLPAKASFMRFSLGIACWARSSFGDFQRVFCRHHAVPRMVHRPHLRELGTEKEDK